MGLLFVGAHTMPGAFTALDASSGAVRWSVSLPGGVRGEALVTGGAVYIGEALTAPDLSSGKKLWSYTLYLREFSERLVTSRSKQIVSPEAKP
jgi:outer membrane protein assembly factor BamB